MKKCKALLSCRLCGRRVAYLFRVHRNRPRGLCRGCVRAAGGRADYRGKGW